VRAGYNREAVIFMTKVPNVASEGRPPQAFLLRSAILLLLAWTAFIASPLSLAQQPEKQTVGTISGSVVDRFGAAICGAKVQITRDEHPLTSEVFTDIDGQFSFTSISPGPFQLTIIAPGFATQTFSATLEAEQNFAVPQIQMVLATAITEVRVTPPRLEISQEQIQEQEKQRVVGVIPNFYVSYVPDAVPLTPGQKFKLAARFTVDPFAFGISAAIAGVEQADNEFSGYGQGAQGYAKRFGAAYADFAIGTFIGSAILPSILKQDPRYFYKGTGSTHSRVMYAIANAVICKGDNGEWQPNYSSILGYLAAGGISNLYYPSQNRNGVGLTFENALIGIGSTAAANLLQEFVIRKLTPNLPDFDPPKSASTISKITTKLVRGGR
jgi:hypothetical protein